MDELLRILKSFSGKKVIIVGDLMLDEYIHGNITRISPEAPIPILKVQEKFYEPGGAANVASNVSTLGGNVSLFGFVGNDQEAQILRKLLDEKRIKSFFDKNQMTTLKTRVIAKSQHSDQQMLRVDSEDPSPKYFSQDIKKLLESELAEADIVIVSDYAKGAVTQELMECLISGHAKVVVGAKQKSQGLYSGVFLLVQNKEEALEISAKEDIISAGRHLKTLANHALITLGRDGMFLFGDREMQIPTYAKEVCDVAGAGDTVLSTVALALASDASLEQSAIIANHAAGIAVARKGTYQVRLNEIERILAGEETKIKEFEELNSIVSDLKRKGKKIVWTNGCFDILHPGHTTYLEKAKNQGDCLIVGLNSDSSVRELKGPKRPILKENERAQVLSSLECVDYILIFTETSIEKYLEAFKPDIYVKGGDYNLETLNQKERIAVENYNGRIVFIPLVEGMSTTTIISKIHGTEGKIINKPV